MRGGGEEREEERSQSHISSHSLIIIFCFHDILFILVINVIVVIWIMRKHTKRHIHNL